MVLRRCRSTDGIYTVPPAQRRFAHSVLERAGVDLVHGHSSHHVKAIEVYNHRLILYGCGDLLNDYEGIRGYEEYRGDLGALYFVTVDLSTGRLMKLALAPTQTVRLRLTRPSAADSKWLADMLSRQGVAHGTSVESSSDPHLTLRWQK